MSSEPCRVVSPLMSRVMVGLTEPPPETTTSTAGLTIAKLSVSPFAAVESTSTTTYAHNACTPAVMVTPVSVNVVVPFAEASAVPDTKLSDPP